MRHLLCARVSDHSSYASSAMSSPPHTVNRWQVHKRILCGVFALLLTATTIIVPYVLLLRLSKPSSAETNPVATSPNMTRTLFDGVTLQHWTGDAQYWSVRNGAVTGQTTTDNSTLRSTFLIWTGGEVADFELNVDVKISGGNSGIQYRSRVLTSNTSTPAFRVGGYQFDFEPTATYSGALYDEAGIAGGRGFISARGERTNYTATGDKVVQALNHTHADLDAAMRQDDWNHVAIVARGPHLVHHLNGVVMTDVFDHAPSALKSGVLALQLHVDVPMLVQFKDIRLQNLTSSNQTM
jgi:hypothetical protein